MPLYFFDVHDSKGIHRDEFGDDFASFEEARDQVQALLPDIARDETLAGETLRVSCDLRDEASTTVYRCELTYQGVRFT